MQVDVLTSGIWQTNSTVVSHRGACLVVDPAYFPRELDAIAARVAELGRASAVAFTHGHWDHVMGHHVCPGAPVWLHQSLSEDIAAAGARSRGYLASAVEFDSRWYVPRPHGHRWPATVRGVADGEALELAGAPLHALHLPGHSPDGVALLVEPLGVLLVGDYLSPCEIPFVDQAQLYRGTLQRLLAVLGDSVAEVIPGHGPRLSAAQAQTIARADLAYIDGLLEAAASGDRQAALALQWPRAQGVVGMREAHLENCAKLGLAPPSATPPP